MDVIGISDENQADVFAIVASVLHLGNISFAEDGNYATPADEECKSHGSSRCCSEYKSIMDPLFTCSSDKFQNDPLINMHPFF